MIWLSHYGEYFFMHLWNCPLDSKEAVYLADFDQSIQGTGDPQNVMRDLEVISVI